MATPFNHSIAMDDGIKASLATLELVKYTNQHGTKSLSNNEVESAHVSLDQIIRTVESIKGKLPARIAARELDDITSSSESYAPLTHSTSPVHEDVGTTDEDSTKNPPDSHSTTSSTNDSSEPPQRRLSTPCIIPMETAGVGVSSSRWSN